MFQTRMKSHNVFPFPTGYPAAELNRMRALLTANAEHQLAARSGIAHSELEDSYVVHFNLVGHSKETVEVTSDGEYVHVEAPKPEGALQFVSSHSFDIQIPESADDEAISAEVVNGILTVRFEKLKPVETKATKIVVQ
jgi:HSP20 family molecular chaperone IbpA